MGMNLFIKYLAEDIMGAINISNFFVALYPVLQTPTRATHPNWNI